MSKGIYSFRYKTVLGVALIEAIMLALIVWNALDILTSSNELELVKRAKTTTKLFASANKDAVISTDLATIETLVEAVINNPGIMYARVIGINDIILAKGGDEIHLARNFTPDKNYDEVKDGVFDYYSVVEEAGVSYGRVEIGFSISEINNVIARARRRGYTMAGIALMLSAVFSLILGAYLTRSINHLRVGTEKIAAGQLGYQIEVRGADELAEAAEAFNQMSVKLEQYETARKVSEGALLHRKAEFESIFNSISDAVIFTDAERRIILTNPAFTNLFGYSFEEVSGKTTPSLHAGFDGSKEQERKSSHSDAWANGDVREIQYRSKDDTTILGEAVATPVKDSDGNLMGYVEIFRDITDRKALEEEVRRSQKLDSIGILAGGIAHDFNNLLTAIMGNINLVKLNLPTASKNFERLEEAEKASLRATDLTKQLLTFSKGGAPVKKSASLKNLLKEASGFAVRGSNVSREILLQEDLWPVNVDEGQISQVIHNLVLNGCHAMPQGGKITLRANNVVHGTEDTLPVNKGKYARIEIEDRGVGIPDGDLKRIFDPYFSTKQKGSGLGLAVAYSIVKNHDGHILVASQPGSGTTFTIYLPVSGIQISDEVVTDEQVAYGEGKILLMDDEVAVSNVAGAMMRKLGYEVSLASDGTEAIELFRKAHESSRPFDVVILDLTIPGGMGGKEAIKHLREIEPGVKAIVSSGYSEDPVMARFKSYGFMAVIAKPYKMVELGRLLHTLTAAMDG